MLIGVIAVIIFLSIFILVHELGHFLAAKKFGLLVEEFGFGLPPRIWAKKIGETLYSINALPFGGFVKIYGEDREENAEVTDNPEASANGRSYGAGKQKDAETEDFSTSVEKETIIVNDNRVFAESFQRSSAYYQRLSTSKDRSLASLPISKRAIIISAGVLMNFLLGWLLISVIFSIGIPKAILVTGVKLNSPAAEIGLLAGDEILSIEADSRRLDTQINADDFIKFVNEYQGQEVVLKIERNGKISDFRAIPRVNPPTGEGALGIGLIEVGFAKKNFLTSIWEGLKASLEIVQAVFVMIVALIAKIFTTGKVDLEQIAGPVGIVKITSQAGALGFIYLLQLLALISLNLVVINIFPFPALDGGRLLFLLIEKIKGSPLPAKFEKYANALGMAFLIFLMIAITIKDIIRL